MLHGVCLAATPNPNIFFLKKPKIILGGRVFGECPAFAEGEKSDEMVYRETSEFVSVPLDQWYGLKTEKRGDK